MKSKIYSLQIILYFFFSTISFAQSSLSGKILDANDKSPLPGATLYFPDLKTGTAANSDGIYQLTNLPKGKFTLVIKYIGYNALNTEVEISATTTQNFELIEGVIESKEFIVTGVSQATERSRTPTPVTLVSKSALIENTSTNIIDALAKQPGITQLSTGQGISKPVIRGLGYNRVVVVNDGIRQEGQQWGDEHGIELDEYSVHHVEILKGPASLSYGSDAMAGVIHFISAPTANQGEINANLMSNYQSNNSLVGYSANVNGNLKGFVWDARVSQKKSGNYQNKLDGKVFNSAFNENNFNGIIGLNKKWGYSHLHFGYYNLNVGLSEGERDSASGRFLKQVATNDSTVEQEIASSKDLNGFALFNPCQIIKHSKLVLNNSIVLGRGRIAASFGFQQNQRQEFGDVLNPKQYGLFFYQNTLNYDLRYVLPEKNNWNVSLGANGMQQTSQNKGIEFLIPAYTLFDVGGFLIVKKALNKLDVSGGIRVDSRTQSADELYLDSVGNKSVSTDAGAILKFKKFNRSFSGVSGSLGATYQFSENFLTKLNISRGYRAPNISELAANGEHEGTLRFELGNTNLKPETSWQVDLDLGWNTEHLSIELDLFNNRLNNFIFPVKLSSVDGTDSINNGLSTFKYVSGNANLMGGEISFDLHPHPLDWLHFENSFSYVQAFQLNQSDSTQNLPFTPAPKLISELKANKKTIGNWFKNAYAKVEAENYFAQSAIYSAAQTETATPAYTLINAGVGTDIINKSKKTVFSFFVSVNNIGDVAYQSHLSRLKYAPENLSTGRKGIYNMGRNVSFKLILPIALKQNK